MFRLALLLLNVIKKLLDKWQLSNIKDLCHTYDSPPLMNIADVVYFFTRYLYFHEQQKLFYIAAANPI